MKSGGVISSDLTKVPKGFTDPNKKVESGKDKKSTTSMSRKLGTINLAALGNAVRGAMKDLPASETPYLLGYTEPEKAEAKAVDQKGAQAAGGKAAKTAGSKAAGGKMSVSSGKDKARAEKNRKAAMKSLKKAGYDLKDLGIKEKDIPDDVAKNLASGKITADQAMGMIKKANKKKVDKAEENEGTDTAEDKKADTVEENSVASEGTALDAKREILDTDEVVV